MEALVRSRNGIEVLITSSFEGIGPDRGDQQDMTEDDDGDERAYESDDENVGEHRSSSRRMRLSNFGRPDGRDGSSKAGANALKCSDDGCVKIPQRFARDAYDPCKALRWPGAALLRL
jgi:hypothetical protein